MGNGGSGHEPDPETDFEEPEIDDSDLEEIDFEGVDFDERFEQQNPDAPESVKTERRRFLAMTTAEKRDSFYADTGYVQLDEIAPWTDFYARHATRLKELYPSPPATAAEGVLAPEDLFRFEVDETLNDKVSPFVGDITTLEVDAVVNAANSSLSGGTGVDGAIHRGAGKQLRAECRALGGCETGDAKTTAGYRLPAKYVVHAVGPKTRDAATLRSCYVSCMREMVRHGMRSIAFCCISTGAYGYPHDRAVHVALRTVRRCLERMKRSKMVDRVDRVVFGLFRPEDVDQYERWMQVYFPTRAAENEVVEKDDDLGGECDAQMATTEGIGED